MDSEQLREYGHRMVDFIADYYKTIETFPVLSQVQVTFFSLWTSIWYGFYFFGLFTQSWYLLIYDTAWLSSQPFAWFSTWPTWNGGTSSWWWINWIPTSSFLNHFWYFVFWLSIDNLMWVLYLADVKTKILPGITHWQSPTFYAYYPSNSSVAGFLGEMLSAGLGIVGFSWVTSPAATELEMIVLDWLAKLLNLPEQFLSKGYITINT